MRRVEHYVSFLETINLPFMTHGGTFVGGTALAHDSDDDEMACYRL